MSPEILDLESHGTGYGGAGRVSTICWPNGSTSVVPQSCQELIHALMLARLELG